MSCVKPKKSLPETDFRGTLQQSYFIVFSQAHSHQEQGFYGTAITDNDYFPPGTVSEDEFHTIGSMEFVWDKAKEQHNIEVHGIDFRTAALIFNDDARIEIFDEENSIDEDRIDAIGYPMKVAESLDASGNPMRLTLGTVGEMLFVVYTERIVDEKEVTRIISARLATKYEQSLYNSGR